MPQLNINTPSNLMTDDINADGFAQFDLTVNNESALNGLDPNSYSVDYFESYKMAEQNVLAFEAPNEYYNMDPFTEAVFVRVSKKNDPAVFGIASFKLIVHSASQTTIAAAVKFNPAKALSHRGFINFMPATVKAL